MPTAEDLAAAAEVVGAALAPTPVLATPSLGDGVVCKLETFQPTGSFKVRGGLAAVHRAARDGVAVVTASAGNHGLGVAYAATRFGVDATVVIPENASEKKRAALERFAVTLVRHGHSYEDAEAHALSLAASRHIRFVSPYNDPDTIAGQSTIVTELRSQLDEIRTIVVPIGGGGLVSGVALAAPDGVRVVGVVPEASPAMLRAYERGAVEHVDIAPTLADGLAGNLEPDTVTFPIIRERVESIVAVTEEEIGAAVRTLVYDHGVVTEGSGAVGVAALQTGKVRADGTTVVLLTGRNIAPATLVEVLGER